jgi:integrase/recombinase XerD
MNIVKSIDDILIVYLLSKKADGLSKHTLKSYESKIKIFINSAYCTKDINNITRGDIQLFIWHYAENHAASTTFTVFNVLKIFFTWVENQLGTDWKCPMQTLKSPKVPQKILDPIEISDIQKMLTYCNTRNRALLMFLLDSGARSQEILSLNVENVDLFSGEVYIEHGKGNKSRYTYICAKTRKVLRKYLQERKYQTEALFTTSVGNRLSYSGLNAILKKLCKKAGIPPVSAHGFRRSFTLAMIRSRQIDLLTLSVILGHSSQVQLSKYAKIAAIDTMEAHRRASPVDNML